MTDSIDQPAAAATEPHDHTLRRWTCGCDPMLVGLMQAAKATGNIDVRVMRPTRRPTEHEESTT